MKTTLTRVVTFHAKHRYYKAEWSEAENRRLFGVYAEAPGHGHLYRVEVTVSGPLIAGMSMIVDLGHFDGLLSEAIVKPLNGHSLNEVIPEFATGNALPTCEALAAWCWNRISDRLAAPVILERVRVAEDETLWAECSERQTVITP